MLKSLLCVALATAQPMHPAQPYAQPGPRLISMAEALAMAEAQHPDLVAARADVAAAQAAAHSLRGRLLPRVDIIDMQNWARAKPSADADVLPGLDVASLRTFPTDSMANVLAISASQPLLGLMHLSQDYRATRKNAQAQRHTHAAQIATLKAQVQSQLVRLFKARAMAQTAISSQQSLEEQVEDARQEATAGVLANTDVLRMEVAAAQAKQQVIAAQADAETLHADLIEMLDLADAPGPVDFIEPDLAVAPVSGLVAAPQLREQALTQRPELAAYTLLAQAADHQAKAKALSLLPEVDAKATYGHLFAQPRGVPDARGGLTLNVFTVMLSAKWGVWEWGASAYAQRQAHHAAVAARARHEAARRRVGSEVAARRASYLASASALDVAQAQVASAEEAFRVMQVTRSAGSATTTDLLQAEAARTQARMSLISARYDTVLAHVALLRALGADTPANAS